MRHSRWRHCPWERRLLSAAFCGVLLACSSDPALNDAGPKAPSSAERKLPPGSLGRDEVVAVVDQGLGRFLQRVAVEPSLDQGRFQGFRVLALQPENFWREVDLRPGDVVTAVNGKSVESDVVVFEVFESLRTVDALDVTVIREGRPRQLHYRIVGPPQPAKEPPPPGGNGAG